MKQGLKLKQDFGNRRGFGPRERFAEQAFGESVVARVKGGQGVHFLCGESRDAAGASQQTREDAGEAGQGPFVSLTRRMEVDALLAFLLVLSFVLGSQRVEIMRPDWIGILRRRCWRMTSSFTLVPFAKSQVGAFDRVQLDFVKR